MFMDVDDKHVYRIPQRYIGLLPVKYMGREL